MASSSRCSASYSTRLLLTGLACVVLLGSGEASGAQLTASWIDNSSGVATTRVERRPGTDTTFTPIADVPPGVTSFVDASLSAGTAYCYRLLAYDSTSASPYSGEACATTSTDGSALTLTISKSGDGTGLVTSTPSGISCDPTCAGSFATSVTLAAAADTGSTFKGWSGGGCSGTDPCTIAGNAPVNVTASFSRVTSTPTTPSGDSTPPVITLTLPTTFARKSAVTLGAAASDNVGVAKVEFYVNGSLKCSNAAGPYTCDWRIPAAANKSYVLEARAYDTTGNVGVSPRITVVPE